MSKGFLKVGLCCGAVFALVLLVLGINSNKK